MQLGRESRPRIVIFAPNLMLTVSLEREGAEREQVHFHPGGQGVWVAGMAARLGAAPVLCGFTGGESGELLQSLLEDLIARDPARQAAAADRLRASRFHTGPASFFADGSALSSRSNNRR